MPDAQSVIEQAIAVAVEAGRAADEFPSDHQARLHIAAFLDAMHEGADGAHFDAGAGLTIYTGEWDKLADMIREGIEDA